MFPINTCTCHGCPLAGLFSNIVLSVLIEKSDSDLKAIHSWYNDDQHPTYSEHFSEQGRFWE